MFDFAAYALPEGTCRFEFVGSAGQGFGAFLVGGVDLVLFGEANDSVGKGMSGGSIVIRPHVDARLDPTQNVIIGNAALYGATGGRLFVHGLAGDRFAVRNSGATVVVEGAGLHACSYMTGGTVAILGRVSHNIAAGMTGGTVYLRRQHVGSVNADYAVATELDEGAALNLETLLRAYEEATGSMTAIALLSHREGLRDEFRRVIPRQALQERAAEVRA